MSLRKDIKDAWVADLERDDIKQGNGCLLNEHGEYCCLGRLGVVLKEQFGFDIDILDQLDFSNDVELSEWEHSSDYDERQSSDGRTFVWNDAETDTYYNYDWEILPPALALAIGLESGNPDVVDDEGNRTTLADLNDGGGTFKEIAKIIKESDL